MGQEVPSPKVSSTSWSLHLCLSLNSLHTYTPLWTLPQPMTGEDSASAAASPGAGWATGFRVSYLQTPGHLLEADHKEWIHNDQFSSTCFPFTYSFLSIHQAVTEWTCDTVI